MYVCTHVGTRTYTHTHQIYKYGFVLTSLYKVDLGAAAKKSPPPPYLYKVARHHNFKRLESPSVI